MKNSVTYDEVKAGDMISSKHFHWKVIGKQEGHITVGCMGESWRTPYDKPRYTRKYSASEFARCEFTRQVVH